MTIDNAAPESPESTCDAVLCAAVFTASTTLVAWNTCIVGIHDTPPRRITLGISPWHPGNDDHNMTLNSLFIPEIGDGKDTKQTGGQNFGASPAPPSTSVYWSAAEDDIARGDTRLSEPDHSDETGYEARAGEAQADYCGDEVG